MSSVQCAITDGSLYAALTILVQVREIAIVFFGIYDTILKAVDAGEEVAKSRRRIAW